MVIQFSRPHSGHHIDPSAGVTLVIATNIHLHGHGHRSSGLGPAEGLSSPHRGASAVQGYGSGNRIVRFQKSYIMIRRIQPYDFQNRIVRFVKSYSTIFEIESMVCFKPLNGQTAWLYEDFISRLVRHHFLRLHLWVSSASHSCFCPPMRHEERLP